MALLNKISQILTADLAKELNLKKRQIEPEKGFIERIKLCQPIEKLANKVHLSQNYLSAVIIESIKNCPSIQNVNSLRILVLYHASHQSFWQLVENQQRQEIPSHLFAATAHKIEGYKGALGTILLFEDQNLLQQLNKKFPLQAQYHSMWSAQYLGMASLAVWGTLSDIGLGANLLYYSGFDHILNTQFKLDSAWQLKAQLVFGSVEQKNLDSSAIFPEQYYQVLN